MVLPGGCVVVCRGWGSSTRGIVSWFFCGGYGVGAVLYLVGIVLVHVVAGACVECWLG